MRCIVALKQVIDPYVHIRINKDNTYVENTNVKMTMNPFDEIAVEAAVKFKEQNKISHITAISIGSNSCKEILRLALARGADKAILVQTNKNINPLGIAKILSKIVKRELPKLVLMGKQAIDDDCNQTGQMLAGILGWAQGTFASKLELKNNDIVEVTREVDGGLETLQCTYPVVITTDLRLNKPRVLSILNIMQSKKKPLETISLNDLDINIDNKVIVNKVTYPPKRKAGIKITSVEELVNKLRNEAKAL